MGWTWYHAEHYKKGSVDRKAECDAYFEEGLNSGHFKVLKSTMVGSVYYAAVQVQLKAVTDDNGETRYEPLEEYEKITFGVVFLTSISTVDYMNFGYKNMTETEGPAYYACPDSILDLLDKTTNEYALEWRKKCRERNQAKRILSKLPLGTQIKVVFSFGEIVFRKEIFRGKKIWVDWASCRKITEKMILEQGYELVA